MFFRCFIAEQLFPDLDLYGAYAFDTAGNSARLKKSIFLVILGLFGEVPWENTHPPTGVLADVLVSKRTGA